MSALREILAKFDIQIDGLAKTKQADSAISGVASKLAGVAKIVAAGAIASKIKDWTAELIDQGSALADTSAKLGVNSDNLQEWNFAAKLNGVSAETVAASMKKLQINAAEAAANGAESGGKFKELGVALRDSKGHMRETTEILYDTGIAISKLPSPMERTAALVKTLGKAGADLGPLFNQGEDGLKAALGEIKKLGGGLSEDAIAALDEMGDQTDRWDMALLSVKGTLAAAFLPYLTRMLTALTTGAAQFFKTKDGAQVLQATLISLGAVAGGIALTFLAAWAPAIAGFVGLVLIIDEIKTTLQGGDSLLARWLGPETVAKLKKDLEDLIALIKRITHMADDIRENGVPAATRHVLKISDKTPEETIADATDPTGMRSKILRGQARVAKERSNEAGDQYFKPETIGQIHPDFAQNLGDQIRAAAGDMKEIAQSSVKPVQGQDETFREFIGRLQKYGEEQKELATHVATAPAAATKDGKPDIGSQTNTVQSNTTITFQGGMSNPDDVEVSVRSAMNDSNRAALAALSGATP